MISAKNRNNAEKYKKRRLNILDKLGIKFKSPHGTLIKGKPLGCRRSKCRICHPEKYDDKIQETEV